ncbi:MAG TPA: hypothetical protein VIY48_17935 [Candidatus Paceibacterota bacterium]
MTAPSTATQRLLPGKAAPGFQQAAKTIVVNGRTYTAVDGTTVDAPAQDVAVLTANGWFLVGGNGCLGVGATSARPTSGYLAGSTYVDTTLGYIVVADGDGNWYNPVTGAAV